MDLTEKEESFETLKSTMVDIVIEKDKIIENLGKKLSYLNL